MESNKNNKKKNKNYYKYHNNHNKFYNKNNNHNNHNNKKFYYYKNKNKNEQNIVIDNNQNNQENQNINILLNNEQQVNQSIQENNQKITKDSPEQEYQRPIQQVIKENSSDYEELEFVPVKKGQRVNFNDKPGFFKYALGFVLLVAIVFGVSYSFFNYRQEDSRQGDIASGEVYVTLDGNTQTLTLNKMYPRTTEEARARNDNYIDFTIRGKNTSETKEINSILSIANGDAVSGKTRINPQYLMVDLQEKVGNEYQFIKNAVPLSSFSYNYVVPVNTTTEIVKEYRLRIWVSDSIIISDTEANASYTQQEFANLYANLHVEINSQDQTYVPPQPTAVELISAIQGLETTPYGKIYVGSNPDNYVWFNNEQWRIIGVYDDKIKIIRNNSPMYGQNEGIAYDTNDGDVWDQSSLKTYLINTYYPTLSQTAKDMIYENATWYVSPSEGDVETAVTGYENAQQSTWQGKIGIITTYEYLYAAGTACRNTAASQFYQCIQDDWLYQTITDRGLDDAWTMNAAAIWGSGGDYHLVATSNDVYDYYLVASPVVFLKSDVIITGGNGQAGETNSYKLGFSE